MNVLRVLPRQPGHPCAYLPQRQAADRGFAVTSLSGAMWHEYLAQGYRRAGAMIYQPACAFCAECRPLRIDVSRFRPGRTQRRVLRTNADIEVSLGPVATDAEHAALYKRYITMRHDGMMSGSERELVQFLGVSPVETQEIRYRLDGRLVGVGVTDVTPRGWSAVYCYFDPEMPKRSLGVLNVLQTVRLCREMCPAGEKSKVYLGYWVKGSKTMGYKNAYRPHEVMEWGTGRWVETEESERAEASAVHGAGASA